MKPGIYLMLLALFFLGYYAGSSHSNHEDYRDGYVEGVRNCEAGKD